MLICKPALVFCYRCCAVAVGTDPKRIAPLAAAPDIARARGHACVMLVENPAHRQRLSISVCGERSAGRGSGARVTDRVSRWGTACPWTRGPPRPGHLTETEIAMCYPAGSANMAGATGSGGPREPLQSRAREPARIASPLAIPRC